MINNDKMASRMPVDYVVTGCREELLTAAKVPATASKDYCLLFKFEDE